MMCLEKLSRLSDQDPTVSLFPTLRYLETISENPPVPMMA